MQMRIRPHHSCKHVLIAHMLEVTFGISVNQHVSARLQSRGGRRKGVQPKITVLSTYEKDARKLERPKRRKVDVDAVRGVLHRIELTAFSGSTGRCRECREESRHEDKADEATDDRFVHVHFKKGVKRRSIYRGM